MENDISKWKVTQLKDHLRTLGLPVSGNKTDLIQRIRDFTSAQKSPRRSPKKDKKSPHRSPNKDKKSPRRTSKKDGVLTGENIDVDRLILLELDDIQLKAVCGSNKYATSVCNEVFWKQRVEQKYGAAVANAKPTNMTYRKQYFTLPMFVSKGGNLVISRRLNAIKQGRLDAFIAYKNVWNTDTDLYFSFHILVKKGYKDIFREILLTYGEYVSRRSISVNPLLKTINELAKQDDVELLDLLYNQFLIKTSNPFPRSYIYEILIATTGNKVLKWAIDNNILKNTTVDIYAIFIRNPKDELRIIKFLAEHNIFPTIKHINESFKRDFNSHISPASLNFLISKGIITPTIIMANFAAKYGKLNILKLLAKRRILPDSTGANAALSRVDLYVGLIMPAVKWMYEQGIEPNDKDILREKLYPPEGTLDYPDAREDNEWLKSAFEDLL